MEKPNVKPLRPFFSSGPCAKRPGWSLSALDKALLGRSHRSAEGRARLKDVITRSRNVLGLPSDWRLGIVPASDTGAVEMVLWSLAGQRGVDVLSFESFTATWAHDLRDALALPDLRVLDAPYGQLPDFQAIDWTRDVVFAWNGTTSGVCVPDRGALPAEHDGLAICDATSAAFAMDLPWDRLDIVTWSWQKALGGEAAHGMLAISPKAALRLQEPAPRALPKLFRLANRKGLIEGIFAGDTINTPSMLCVEDALDSLLWAERIGGLPALKARCEGNLAVIAAWVRQSGWAAFLAENPRERSCTSICLKVTAPWFMALENTTQAAVIRYMTDRLAEEGAGYDLASYRDAPPGLRIWGGATVEQADIAALLPWLDWAYAAARKAFSA